MPDPLLCEACQIERSGSCGCDGSVDDGCFLCAPDKHKRPDCPSRCPGFGERLSGMIRADAKLQMSANAIASIAAAGRAPRERSESEKAFDNIVRSAKLKSSPHAQKPISKEHADHLQGETGMAGQRLYTVTTIAASERFGGKRTVAVCSTFERAKEMVEQNEGDIYETSYQLAVIEAVASDWLYYIIDEQYWYVWDGDLDTGGYKPIERPEAYDGCVNIGIG
jgi:hypothetical protein